MINLLLKDGDFIDYERLVLNNDEELMKSQVFLLENNRTFVLIIERKVINMANETLELRNGKWVEATPLEFKGGLFYRIGKAIRKLFNK